MELKGIVKETDGKAATVKVLRKEACSHCQGRIVCGRAKSYEIKALNEIGAKPGDIVKVSGSDRGVLMYAFLLFILPIALSAICYFSLSGTNRNLSYIAAAVGFLLPYIAAFVADRRLSGKLSVRITEIDTGEDTAEVCDE